MSDLITTYLYDLDTFADVIREVGEHVQDTGHQDIRVRDDPPGLRTGYVCRECVHPGKQWMTHVDTVRRLPDALKWQAVNSTKRAKLVGMIVKKALEPQPYRPTAWERVLRA